MVAPDKTLLDAIQAALDAIDPLQVAAFRLYLQELLDLLDAM